MTREEVIEALEHLAEWAHPKAVEVIGGSDIYIEVWREAARLLRADNSAGDTHNAT